MLKLLKIAEIEKKHFDEIRIGDVLDINPNEYQRDFIEYVAEKIHRDGYL